MTKKDLIKSLEPYPENMDVFLAERKTDFKYGLLNSAKIKQIGFKEDPEDEGFLATDTVIILDEE